MKIYTKDRKIEKFMDKISIIHRFENENKKQAILGLARIGTKAGFDIIWTHENNFNMQILYESDLIIMIDISALSCEQKDDLKGLIVLDRKPFVRCLMSLNDDSEKDDDIGLCKESSKNYFCSPKIFRFYVNKFNINGSLSYLFGRIDDSWDKIICTKKDNENEKEKSIIDFWRDIDILLQRKKAENVCL